MDSLIKFLGIVFIIALSDRAIPAGGARYALSDPRFDEKRFWKLYGRVSFPRTHLAVIAVVVCAIVLFLGLDDGWEIFGAACCLPFVGCAMWDALSAYWLARLKE